MDHIYKYLRWLSLDIVLGAIFFLAYLEKYYQTSLSWNVYLALASAIWLIYTTDHLLDARSLSVPTSERHLFHKKNFKGLVFISGLILCLGLVNMYFLEIEVIRNGAILSAISVAYLVLVYFIRRLWVKELVVALVYAMGVFLGPWSMIEDFSYLDIILLIQLIGIALLNLFIFSFYDRVADLKDGFNSLVLRLGANASQFAIITLGICLMIACVAIGIHQEIQQLYLVMISILMIVHLLPNTFSKSAFYRTVGDGIFYLPGLFLLL